MNHDEAIRLKAAEKYLLGELSAEMRDQYEDHYFGCAECAQDVRTGAVFIDNARDVLLPPSVTELGAKHQPARSGGWWAALLRPAFAVPALALLLLVAGYQNAVTIPHLKTAVSQSETRPNPAIVFADLREFAWRRSAFDFGSGWQAVQLFCGHSPGRQLRLLRLRVSNRIWNIRIVP